ncbi:MAG: glycoside hydrolase, partial [bacterium]
TAPGHHRFVWDLRHEPPPGSEREFAIAAVYRNTPSGPHGPFVHPGRYTIRLMADGAVLERPLEIRLDPRVNISAADLQLQTDNSLACYNGYLRLQTIRESIDAALQNPTLQRNVKKREALQALRGSGLPGNSDLLYGSITAASADKETIVGLQNKFLYLLNVLQSADVRPTQQTIAGAKRLEEMMEALVRRWEDAR